MRRNIMKLSFLYGSSHQILRSTQFDNGILQMGEIPMITLDLKWRKKYIYRRTFWESRSNEILIRTKLNVSSLLFSHLLGHARHISDVENRKCLCCIEPLQGDCEAALSMMFLTCNGIARLGFRNRPGQHSNFLANWGPTPSTLLDLTLLSSLQPQKLQGLKFFLFPLTLWLDGRRGAKQRHRIYGVTFCNG